MAWFGKKEAAQVPPKIDASEDWRSFNAPLSVACPANPAVLPATAAFEDRLLMIASQIGSLHRRLNDLIPEAESLYGNAPTPGEDPHVKEALQAAQSVTCIGEDFGSFKSLLDLGQLVKGIESAMDDGDEFSATFAGFIAIGTGEVLSTLTGILWALHEPNRNVWGAQYEVYGEQRDPFFDSIVEDTSLPLQARVAAALSTAETNLLGMMWCAEAIFARINMIKYHMQ